MMLYEIFRFEIKRAFQKPAIYLYWLLLFLLSFILINAAGGAIKSINIHLAGENVFINAPGVLDILFGMYSYLGIFIVAAICSNIVFKDFSHNTLELTFSTPLRKHQYIFGRFFAAFSLSIFVFTGVAIGFYIGTLMPYLNQSLIGPNHFDAYFLPYLKRIIPNLFLVCSIFFSLSLLLRSVVINWISIIGLYVLYAISMSLFSDLENQNLASLLDPFGIAASLKVSSAESVNDMNEKGTQLIGVFFYNRLLWSFVGSMLLLFTHFRFRFSYNLRRIKLFKRRENTNKTVSSQVKEKIEKPTFSQKENNRSTVFHLFKFELKKLLSNVYFLLIGLVTIIFLFVAAGSVGKMYDTNTYPVTYQMLGILSGSVKLFLFIVIMIFSGEMIWRDRDLKVFELSQSFPQKRWTSLLSKFFALNVGVILILLALIVCGVFSQSLAAYYNFELGLYFTWIFGVEYVNYFLLIVLAFFLHHLINHKYAGYVALILYWIIDNYFAYHLFKHHLLVYAGGSSITYSDMNQFGFQMFPYWIFKIYWILIAFILLIFANQLQVTQTEQHLKLRFNLFANRIKKSALRPTLFIACITVIVGSYIFYQTNIQNEFITSYENEIKRVKYEQKYKKFEKISQPKITDVSIKVDLFPENGNVYAKGTYQLTNKSNQVIDTLLVHTNQYLKNIQFSKAVRLVKDDKEQDIQLYVFNEGLQSNDKVKISFEFCGENKGFSHSGSEAFCRQNGTFLYNSIFPSFGYDSRAEISSRKIRQKHQLPEKELERNVNDSWGIEHNFITNDADFINFNAIISTSADQIALTPGKKLKEWTENNRKYFHYQSEKPMLNYYAILSGRYEILSDRWIPKDTNQNPVDISILYHKGHEYNLKSMMKGVKESLSKYSSIYSPYQYEQLRIVEFPRYSSYAQSFPNMIPFSEGIGFIADLRELENKELNFDQQPVDYPFFVTTHEMAHQWWAHQIVAADVEGAQMLMESITQFSALQCMKEYYGEEKMKKFFKNEMNKYIISRKQESNAERPLSRVARHQSTTYYNKGSLVMNSLNEYLGKDRFLPVIQSFLHKHAFKDAPYPTAQEFVYELKNNCPDSLKYFVEDQLEKITFYQTKVDSANYQRNKDFSYTVTSSIDIQKSYSDGKGKATETNCNDYIELGFFNSKDQLLEKRKVKLHSGNNQLKFQLKRKPSYLIVDPNYYIMMKDYTRKRVSINKKKKV